MTAGLAANQCEVHSLNAGRCSTVCGRAGAMCLAAWSDESGSMDGNCGKGESKLCDADTSPDNMVCLCQMAGSALRNTHDTTRHA